MIIFLLVHFSREELPDSDSFSETNWPQPEVSSSIIPMVINRKADIILSPFVALLGNIIK
jgi:hypothetical protein